MSGRTALNAAAGVTIGAGCLYLAMRGVHASEILGVLAKAEPRWLALALALYWLELMTRVARWRLLLTTAGQPLGLRETAFAFVVGYAANNVLPAKLGELVRVDVVARQGGISRMAALGTLVVERLFDIALVLLMAAIGLSTTAIPAGHDLAQLQRGMLVVAGASLGLVALMLVLHRLGQRSAFALAPRLRRGLEHVGRAANVLFVPSQLADVLGRSLLAWGLNGASIWLVLHALGVDLGVLQLLVLMGIAGIAAALPAPPAGFGVLQYAFVLAFAVIGQGSALALVAAGLIQLVLLGSVTLAGALLVLAQLAQAARRAQASHV